MVNIELFNDEEIEIYRDFAEQLSRLISNIDKDTKYYVGSQDLIILANTRYRLILGE